MLSNILNPVFSPVLLPIGNYLRPETETDTSLTSLKAQLKDKIDKINEVNNPTLHKQLSQLQKDVNALDLTRNCLPFQEDREDAEKLAKGIIKLVEKALLLLPKADGLINLPSTHQNHRVVDKATAKDIRALCNEILGQVGPLKLLSEKSPILWKDEAWKNLLFFVGATALIALGCSTAPVFIGGGALWLVYYAQLNYRKDIFDNAAKLLNRVTTETLEIKQTITELRAETADAEAATARVEAENAKAEAITAKARAESAEELGRHNTEQILYLASMCTELHAEFKAFKSTKTSVLREIQNEYDLPKTISGKLKVA